MSFVAGQYTATLAAASMGQIKEGIRIGHTVHKRPITGDNFAKARQDAVWQGIDVYTAFTLLEYNGSAARAAFWAYGSTYLTMGVIGRLDSAVAAQLVLTAIAGTSAATAPATVTLPLCVLSEGFPVELLFAPDLREVPVRQDVYPNASGIFGTLT